MTTAVSFSKTGAQQESGVKLDKAIFGLEANHELVGQAYRTYLANGRLATATTLSRGNVRGGGKKPWRQKGTGRARVGSIRVPNWRGGGVVFGPSGNENYSLNMPIKMKRQALRQALSLQAAAGKVIILEAFDCPEGRVKPTIELLAKMKLAGTILLAVSEKDRLVERATRNVSGLKAISANYLNVFDIMNADTIVLTKESLDTIKAWLGEK